MEIRLVLIFTESKILNLNIHEFSYQWQISVPFSHFKILPFGEKDRRKEAYIVLPVCQLLKLNYVLHSVVPILCLSCSYSYANILKISLYKAFHKHFFFSNVIRSLSCRLRHLNSSLSTSAKGYRGGNGKVIPLRFPICTWI